MKMWLFNMWSMCFFSLQAHFSSLPTFVMSLSGCGSSGPRGGYPSTSPRKAQPHRVSEERGQSPNATIQQWVVQHFTDSPTHWVLRGASLSALNSVHTYVCLFVCVCNTFGRVQCLGESCITLYGKGTNKKTKILSFMCQELNHSDMWIFELHSHYANILYHIICVSFFSRLALWDPAAGAVCGEAFRCCDRSAAQFLEALDLLR